MNSKKSMTLEDFEKLDFDYLEKKLIRRDSWDPERAQSAVKQYKRFLFLKYKYPKEPLVPLLDLDEVWHSHILYTIKYTEDCNRLFGKYMHHFPSNGTEEEKKELNEIFQSTMDLYFKEFGEPYYLIPLQVSDF